MTLAGVCLHYVMTLAGFCFHYVMTLAGVCLHYVMTLSGVCLHYVMTLAGVCLCLHPASHDPGEAQGHHDSPGSQEVTQDTMGESPHMEDVGRYQESQIVI